MYAYGSAGSAIIHALVPTAAMRTGDFSAAALSQLPRTERHQRQLRHFQHAAHRWRQRLGAHQRQHRRVPQSGRDGNGQRHAAAAHPRADRHRRIQLRPLDLVNNNVSQFAGRLDYAISPRNQFFARYSFEKGKQGQPLVPYYEPTSVMGEVNTPGYGVNNDTWVHSACGQLRHRVYSHDDQRALRNHHFLR